MCATLKVPITEDALTGSRLHLDCIVDKFAERVRNLLKGRILYIPIRRPSSQLEACSPFNDHLPSRTQ